MADPTFADFTLETAPAVTDFLVGYRTAVTGGERRTALSALNSLFQANITTGLTANALLQSGGSGALTATNLTYSTPTLSVPDAFAISSAGSIALTAGGSNKSVMITPSGTGSLVINESGAAAPTPSFQGAQLVGASATQSGWTTDTFAAQARYMARRADGTPSSPTAVANNVTLGQFLATGYTGAAYSTARFGMSIKTTEAWDATHTGAKLSFTVGITGVSSAADVAELDGTGRLTVGLAGLTIPAWTTNGAVFRTNGSQTFTDSTSSGTVSSAVAASFAIPTFAASSATTWTDAANLYIAGGPANGANGTITNSWGLWNVGKTRLDNTLQVTTISAPSSVDLVLNSGATNSNLQLNAQGTGSVQIPETAQGGLHIKNTADDTTNYERLELFWSSNVANIRTARGGTGTGRDLTFGASNATNTYTIRAASFTAGMHSFVTSNTGTASAIDFNIAGGTNSATSGANKAFVITKTYNQSSGTAANTDLLINRTETAVGSGAQIFADFQKAGTSYFSVATNGTITGGPQNMTITAGTGNSRTLTLRTTTSGGTATNAVVFSATQAAAFTSTIATAAGVTWDLGALTTATVALDTSRYLAVTVGGVDYKILVST